MGVFLRWGIFGILAVAAVWYAYNASKRISESRATPVAAEPAQPGVQPEAASPGPPASDESTPAHCEEELQVARMALEARRAGEPLDRVLRNDQIAFVGDPKRRERLSTVATRWHQMEGEEPLPPSLRFSVVSDCRRATPAP